MNRYRSRSVSCPSSQAIAVAALVLFSLPELGRAEPTAQQVEFFEKKIRPVLVEHCYKCHAANAKKIRGGLLLDSRDGMRKGRDSRPAALPRRPAATPLLKPPRP